MIITHRHNRWRERERERCAVRKREGDEDETVPKRAAFAAKGFLSMQHVCVCAIVCVYNIKKANFAMGEERAEGNRYTA